MEYKIKEFVYSLFRSVPDCAPMRALRTELTRTMLRRYYSYISAGKTPGEAYDAVLGFAQEMKDRIADAMRSVHTTHTAPPFGGTGRTTRNYGAQSHNADAGAQHREDTQDPRRTRPQEKSNTPGHSRKARSEKPVKKAVSISTGTRSCSRRRRAGCRRRLRDIFYYPGSLFPSPYGLQRRNARERSR